MLHSVLKTFLLELHLLTWLQNACHVDGYLAAAEWRMIPLPIIPIYMLIELPSTPTNYCSSVSQWVPIYSIDQQDTSKPRE